MHEAAGMHLISTCTGNEVGSSYVLAFGSWITFVSCNALGVTLHIGIGDRTMDNGKQLIILAMMIIDSYQRLKDPYILSSGDNSNYCTKYIQTSKRKKKEPNNQGNYKEIFIYICKR